MRSEPLVWNTNTCSMHFDLDVLDQSGMRSTSAELSRAFGSAVCFVVRRKGVSYRL